MLFAVSDKSTLHVIHPPKYVDPSTGHSLEKKTYSGLQY